jgi:hypothetical protein
VIARHLRQGRRKAILFNNVIGTVQSEVGKVINFIDEHGLHIYSTCPRGSL